MSTKPHNRLVAAAGRFRRGDQLTIDNGNHLLLSGNRHALAYAKSIGTRQGWSGRSVRNFRSSI